MSKADVLNAKADEAERYASQYPLLRASYLEIAAVWRSMARQARFIASSGFGSLPNQSNPRSIRCSTCIRS
jgi:hypothetical protein